MDGGSADVRMRTIALDPEATVRAPGLKRASNAGLLSKSNIQKPQTRRRLRLAGRFLRKEVIQPQVPLRLPCYDFTPVADLTVVGYWGEVVTR